MAMGWAAAVGGLAVLLFVVRAIRDLRYPFTLNYGEGLVLNFSQLWHAHGTYFFDIAKLPYVHGTYPPVMPILLAPLASHPLAQLMTGRLLSVAATLVVALSCYSILRWCDVKRFRAMVFTGLFFAPIYVAIFGTLVRVDMLAVAFSTLGLAVYVRAGERLRYRLIAILFLVIAFYTKHTTIAVPLALGLSLLTERRWRRAGELVALYGLAVLGLFAYGHFVTGGEFTKHMITYSAFLPLHFAQGKKYWTFFLLSIFGLLLIWLVGRKQSLPAWLRWYPIALLPLIIGAAKPGADLNYFIEPYLGALLVGAVIFERLLTSPTSNFMRNVACIGLLTQAVVSMNLLLASDVIYHPLQPSGHAEQVRLSEHIMAAQGPILTEDWGPIILAGQAAFYESFQFAELAQAGLWDDREFIAACERGSFALVVAGNRLLATPRLVTCLEQSYELVEQTTSLRFYRPRNSR